MAWTTFHLSVTTPLFNHDDPTTGLRVASVRGAMRFWFRALAGTRYGSNVAALARAEQWVFGSTERACPVRLRLSNQPGAHTMAKANSPAPFLDGALGKGVAYLLGQGHVRYGWRDADNRCQGEDKRYWTTRPHTRTGHRFVLKVAFSGDAAVDSLTLASLWLACAYGGFGSRTRKGFGNVRLTYEDGPLPKGPWQSHTPNSPDLDHYRTLTHLPLDGPIAACADLLPPGKDTDDPSTAPYPILGEGATTAALAELTADHWWEAASQAGEQYRRFRASQPNRSPKANYSPLIKTPEYEAVIHGPGDHFPLGALGLPVNYKGNAKVTVFEGQDEVRRASPLWFRFLKDEEEDRWRLFSFAFLNPFLPPGQNLRVAVTGKNARNKNVDVFDVDVRQRAGAWMDLITGKGVPASGQG